MLRRVLIAICVGILVAIVVYVIGLFIALLPGAQSIGSYIVGVSALLGVLAAVWYFLTNRSVV